MYFRDNGPKTKLRSKWIRGIFLGLAPKTDGWLIGAYTPDKNNVDRWTEYTSLDCKFREEILIGNLEDLRSNSKGIFIHYDKLDALEAGASSVVSPSPGGPAKSAQRAGVIAERHS